MSQQDLTADMLTRIRNAVRNRTEHVNCINNKLNRGVAKVLKEEGVQVVKEIETYEYGKFAHILDCDGLRLELWEPCDEEFDKLISARTKPE